MMNQKQTLIKAFVAFTFLVAGSILPVNAQFGGLLNKAKNAAKREAVKQANDAKIEARNKALREKNEAEREAREAAQRCAMVA